MTTPAQASASSVPCQIGDLSLMLSPLVDRQWGDLTLWLQSRQLRIAKAAIDEGLDDMAYRKELGRAMSWVNRLDARERLTDIIFTLDGLTYWLWQLTRKYHEQLKLEEIGKLIEKYPHDTKNIYEAWTLLQGEVDKKNENPTQAGPENSPTPA